MLNREEAKQKLGMRIQRCSGCFTAFYLKDMWLGPDASYYCEGCKSDTMFHFDQFTEKLDLTHLPTMLADEEESTQCQNPFTRQV
jgi:hypothetical protein